VGKGAVLALAGAAVAWLVLGTMAVATTTGCYGRECDPGPVIEFTTKRTLPDGARVDDTWCGEFLGPELWESSPADADWIDYPPRSFIHVFLQNWSDEGRPFVEVHAYISEVRHPVCNGDGCETANNFSEATGNLAEWTRTTPGSIFLANDTCAHYYVRIVLRAGRPTNPAADAAVYAPSALPPPVALCGTQ
jgi:hypothetical protein